VDTNDKKLELPHLRLDSVIGRGGMATVWRGYDLAMGRPVAVKVLSTAYASTPEDIARFLNEARIMTKIHHPGIARGYDMNRADGHYYVVMELVEGYTFASLIARKVKIPEEDALIVAESVAVAMGYVWDHYKLVHCDIKPENLMVDSDGSVKVTDLGLSKTMSAFKSGADGQSDEIIGTPGFISPEQVYGEQDLDCRADIYSLGATLYMLTTGHMLFEGRTNDDMLRAHVDATQAADPRIASPGLSAGFVELLEHMLVKDKAHRYPVWNLVLRDIQTVMAGGRLPPLPPEAIASMRRDA